MTTEMILIPIDRLKALGKISTDTPTKLPADVEFKLLQQNKNFDGEIPKTSNSTFGNCSGEGKNCPILLIHY